MQFVPIAAKSLLFLVKPLLQKKKQHRSAGHPAEQVYHEAKL